MSKRSSGSAVTDCTVGNQSGLEEKEKAAARHSNNSTCKAQLPKVVVVGASLGQ